jgi:hypothetical protein
VSSHKLRWVVSFGKKLCVIKWKSTSTLEEHMPHTEGGEVNNAKNQHWVGTKQLLSCYLKMDVTSFSTMLDDFHQTLWCYVIKRWPVQSQHCEKLKFNITEKCVETLLYKCQLLLDMRKCTYTKYCLSRPKHSTWAAKNAFLLNNITLKCKYSEAWNTWKPVSDAILLQNWKSCKLKLYKISHFYIQHISMNFFL